jgi:signal transduction histidine kinase
MSPRGFTIDWLENAGKVPSRVSILIGLGLLSAICSVDWITGPQIALSLLYVLPITWTTWQCGRRMGLGMAVASGAAWLGAELLAHANYSNPVIPYWNALVRTLLFVLIAALESEVIERKRVERGLRETKEELEARVQQRTAQLRTLNANLEKQIAERSAAAQERAGKLAISEANLQRQTEILQSILDSMGDGVAVADAHGRLIHINPAAKRLLWRPLNGIDLVRWLESQQNCVSNSPTEPANSENPMLRALRGEAVDGVEMSLRHMNSSADIWLSVNGRPLVDHAGKIAGGVVVFSDISARKNLERQIAEISDREQRRLGEDLHDGLCQHLVSVAFAARKLAAGLTAESRPAAEEAAQIAELLGESIAQARAVARGLYVVPAEAGGLRSALEEFTIQVQTRNRVRCRFAERVAVPITGEALVTNLFRIAQEAINNAVKHATARQIEVTLVADGEQITLRIEDDGTGFQPAAEPRRGLGLHLMNYRARMLGAALHIEPRLGGGTVVSCAVRRETLTEEPTHVKAS